MFDKDINGLENFILHRYIQLAYEFTNRDSSISGNADLLMRHLHIRWMRYVLDLGSDRQLPSLEMEEAILALLQGKPSLLNDHISISTGYDEDININSTGNTSLEGRQEHLADAFEQDYRYGPLREYGAEAYATYWPIHFFFGGGQFDTGWGVYISELGIERLAAALRKRSLELFPEKPRVSAADPSNPASETQTSEKPERISTFEDLAYQILLRHELQHFKIESFTLQAELLLGRPLYVPYLEVVYAKTYPQVTCLEEALANATVLNSTAISARFRQMYPQRNPWEFKRIIAEVFFEHQPPCYQNFELQSGWPTQQDKAPVKGSRQRAMNYLCNQILQSKVVPDNDIVPFYAFPPDNYFLRASDLVPVHIVSDVDAFIITAMPAYADFIKFVKAVGYAFDRKEGSHETWERSGLPPLQIVKKGKNIAPSSYNSTAERWGLGKKKFQEYYKEFQNAKKIPSELSQLIETQRRA